MADTASGADTLSRLLAYESIRQLAARYAVAVDAKDSETIAGLFVPDVRAGEGRTGRAALRVVYDELLAEHPRTILNVGTHVIDLLSEDAASGVVYCRGELEWGEQWVVQAIVYHDDYERHQGEWLFRRRRHLLFYGADVLERPNDLPPAGRPEFGRGRGSMPQYWPTWRRYAAEHGFGPAATPASERR
jgi:hypothetical protein